MNKNNKQEIDLSTMQASLNFAYCPSIDLSINNNLSLKEEMFPEEIKEMEPKMSELMCSAMRYFYICYSVQIQNSIIGPENNYFYFQIFSQLGSQQTASSPVFGFYSQEKIIEIIKDISQIFVPEEHDKHVFDTIQNEIHGTANDVIEIMQSWTKIKLDYFNNLYFKNEKAIKNLYELLNIGTSILEKDSLKNKLQRKKTTIKKINKIKNSPVAKKNKNLKNGTRKKTN